MSEAVGIDKISYHDGDGRFLWEEPMVFTKLWGIGDMLVNKHIPYEVLRVAVANDVQYVNIRKIPNDVIAARMGSKGWKKEECDFCDTAILASMCSNNCGRNVCYDCARNSIDNEPICPACKEKEGK